MGTGNALTNPDRLSHHLPSTIRSTKAMPYAFFDEPQDAIIYMITAALGFAGIENVVYALNHATSPDTVLGMTVFRGISANFLHVVASGFLGYFLALSLEYTEEKRKFLYTGIAGAVLLHGTFNNFIMKLGGLIADSGCSRLLNVGASAGTKCPEELFGISLIGTLLLISGIIILTGLKSPEDASTDQEAMSLFKSQKKISQDFEQA